MRPNDRDPVTELLAERLPQYPASYALKRRLAAQWAEAIASVPRVAWWRRSAFAIPAVAAVVLLLSTAIAYDRLVRVPARATAILFAAAVDNHVRTTHRPLEIESSDRHQVKPWFTGKLDFSPAVPFMGDADFPLRGGHVGSYAGLPAAVLVFGRRLHTITLSVFRPEGLAEPAGDRITLGRARAVMRTVRGFNVALWRADDLGYALVSDLDLREFLELGRRLAGSSSRTTDHLTD
jgi:anti-sigma factor RsiW